MSRAGISVKIENVVATGVAVLALGMFVLGYSLALLIPKCVEITRFKHYPWGG